jgi:hypothetical protein
MQTENAYFEQKLKDNLFIISIYITYFQYINLHDGFLTIAWLMNENINMDSTISGSMNDNINMDSTIRGSLNDNINMDNTIAGSIYIVIH